MPVPGAPRDGFFVYVQSCTCFDLCPHDVYSYVGQVDLGSHTLWSLALLILRKICMSKKKKKNTCAICSCTLKLVKLHA